MRTNESLIDKMEKRARKVSEDIAKFSGAHQKNVVNIQRLKDELDQWKHHRFASVKEEKECELKNVLASIPRSREEVAAGKASIIAQKDEFSKALQRMFDVALFMMYEAKNMQGFHKMVGELSLLDLADDKLRREVANMRSKKEVAAATRQGTAIRKFNDMFHSVFSVVEKNSLRFI